MQLLFVLAIIPLGVAFGYAILVTEMLKAISEFMTAKEIVARLEGELAVVAALRSRPWWWRIAAYPAPSELPVTLVQFPPTVLSKGEHHATAHRARSVCVLCHA
jgi:hypothetical protein